MEKLYELHDETDFDLVVVDTPPTRHALDFLDAPRRLSRFLDHRLFRLLIVPSRGIVKAVNVAAQTFLRTVSRVVGGDGGRRRRRVLPGVRGHGGGVPRSGRPGSTSCWPPTSTAFVLVASPRRDTVDEAHFFADRLHEAGIAVRGLIVNRVHPAFGRRSTRADADGPSGHGAAAAATARGPRPWPARRSAGSTATSPTSRRCRAASRPTSPGWPRPWRRRPVVWVPFLRTDVHDLAGLDEVAAHVFPRRRPTLPSGPAAAGSRRGRTTRRARRRPRRGRRPPTRRSR